MTLEDGLPSMRRKLADWSSAGMPRRKSNMSTISNMAPSELEGGAIVPARLIISAVAEPPQRTGVPCGSGQARSKKMSVDDHEAQQCRLSKPSTKLNFGQTSMAVGLSPFSVITAVGSSISIMSFNEPYSKRPKMPLYG